MIDIKSNDDSKCSFDSIHDAYEALLEWSLKFKVENVKNKRKNEKKNRASEINNLNESLRLENSNLLKEITTFIYKMKRWKKNLYCKKKKTPKCWIVEQFDKFMYVFWW